MRAGRNWIPSTEEITLDLHFMPPHLLLQPSLELSSYSQSRQGLFSPFPLFKMTWKWAHGEQSCISAGSSISWCLAHTVACSLLKQEHVALASRTSSAAKPDEAARETKPDPSLAISAAHFPPPQTSTKAAPNGRSI